ncbi:hypothetical protein L1887_25648 [Cichorium endivia]|nr:hypothetical protein L1887_25648 [Cichorium endivia]
MAVEAPNVNLFSPRIISNREMVDHGNKNVYDDGMKFGYQMAEMDTGLLPMYVPSGMMDTLPATALKADSGLTYSLPISRKRSRDSTTFDPTVLSFPSAQFVNQNQLNNQNGTFTFLGQDISMQIYQQQLEIDRFIAHQTEKVRMEIEATRRRNSMRLIAAAEEGIKKRLRSKEEEIIKIGKLNYALEEKVKSLSVENQIWQQMAQTNEATANVLRRNLQRILTQLQQQQQNQNQNQDKATVDDVQSCCGSNYEEEEHQLGGSKVIVPNQGNDVEAYCTTTGDNNGSRLNRWCRNCGKVESCVLLLPCRHLCICTVCESSINVCPICKSSKNATVHVNMS